MKILQCFAHAYCYLVSHFPCQQLLLPSCTWMEEKRHLSEDMDDELSGYSTGTLNYLKQLAMLFEDLFKVMGGRIFDICILYHEGDHPEFLQVRNRRQGSSVLVQHNSQ